MTIPLANPEPSTNVRYAVRFRGERTSLAPIRTVPYAGLPAGVLGYVRVRMFDFGGCLRLRHTRKRPRGRAGPVQGTPKAYVNAHSHIRATNLKPATTATATAKENPTSSMMVMATPRLFLARCGPYAFPRRSGTAPLVAVAGHARDVEEAPRRAEAVSLAHGRGASI